MVETLQAAGNGTIHSLWDFEQALCATHSCGTLERTVRPPVCPPEYTNDGVTCRAPDGSIISHYRP